MVFCTPKERESRIGTLKSCEASRFGLIFVLVVGNGKGRLALRLQIYCFGRPAQTSSGIGMCAHGSILTVGFLSGRSSRPSAEPHFLGLTAPAFALAAQIPTATAITRTWCSARIARASYTRTASFAGTTAFPTRRGRRTRAPCVRRTSTVWTTPTTATSAAKGPLSSTTCS